MNPFRGYLKVKIQPDHFEKFSSLIPSFTNIVEDTEPKALQFEAFANNKKKEVIWLESYTDNSGFDEHISNPALEALKMKMMPL